MNRLLPHLLKLIFYRVYQESKIGTGDSLLPVEKEAVTFCNRLNTII